MRKLIFTVLSLFIAVIGYSQTQSLEFYYISHDRTTPVNDLPNYDEPKIVKMNLPGDNRDEFKHIISELRLKSAHEIYADIDYANIVDLVNTHDFIDESGTPTFTSVLFCWYVNPDFWQFLYNEKLIAALYFNLELNKYTGYVTTEIWHAAGDGLEIDKEKPFGSKNLCADMMFMLQQY